MKKYFPFFLCCFICLACTNVFAQDVITATDSLTNNDTSFVKIVSINITGNKHTKGYIILREMQFAEGDTLRKDKLKLNFRFRMRCDANGSEPREFCLTLQ